MFRMILILGHSTIDHSSLGWRGSVALSRASEATAKAGAGLSTALKLFRHPKLGAFAFRDSLPKMVVVLLLSLSIKKGHSRKNNTHVREWEDVLFVFLSGGHAGFRFEVPLRCFG